MAKIDSKEVLKKAKKKIGRERVSFTFEAGLYKDFQDKCEKDEVAMSRVLEELMSTKPRNAGVEDDLTKIAALIGEEKEAEARKAIDALAEEIGDTDPEIIRAKLLLDFMDEDEE